MAMIYITLIVKGLKTIEDVPPILKAQVRDLLVAIDLGELTELKNTRSN